MLGRLGDCPVWIQDELLRDAAIELLVAAEPARARSRSHSRFGRSGAGRAAAAVPLPQSTDRLRGIRGPDDDQKQSTAVIGVFAPIGYLVIAFPGEAEAAKARAALLTGGYEEDEVMMFTSSR